MISTSAKTYDRGRPDRRRRPTPMFSRYWLAGRRHGGRRRGEIERIYVDAYTRSEIMVVLGLLGLSAIDLLLTQNHVSAGGTEANPLMAWVLREGGVPGFTIAKVALTLIATAVLLLHVRFRLARRALQVLLVVYLCVMVWHGVVLIDRTG